MTRFCTLVWTATLFLFVAFIGDFAWAQTGPSSQAPVTQKKSLKAKKTSTKLIPVNSTAPAADVTPPVPTSPTMTPGEAAATPDANLVTSPATNATVDSSAPSSATPPASGTAPATADEKSRLRKTIDDANATLEEIPNQRAALPLSVGVNAAIFETWVITKYGLNVSYAPTAQNAYEFEYMAGSLGFGFFGFDLGKIEEQKFSLLWRSYAERKTLSFFTGLTYNKFAVHLGNEYLETVTGSQRANVDLAEIATLGATWGFGQRWHTKNGFIWGVDWLTLTLPLVVINEHIPFVERSQSAERREDVSSAAKLFKRIPSVGVLKLQLAYSF